MIFPTIARCIARSAEHGDHLHQLIRYYVDHNNGKPGIDRSYVSISRSKRAAREKMRSAFTAVSMRAATSGACDGD